MKKRGLLIGLTSICLSLGTISLVTSCSCDDPNEKVINVSSVELKASTNSLKVGQTINLETTISPEDATNKNVTYTSSDETIATVSASGVVTALKAGNVTITVTTEDGNKTSSVNLTVVEESEVESGLTIDEVSEILDESPYTSSELSETTNFGLSDATNVGVNQSEITEKYTIPNFDEIDNGVILTLDELTLDEIKTVIPEATELNDYYRFEGALLLAKKENDNGNVVKIVLPSRTLEINGALASTSAVFNIDGANGIYVEGNNATFLISISGLNWKGFLNATNSKDVILKDYLELEQELIYHTGLKSNPYFIKIIVWDYVIDTDDAVIKKFMKLVKKMDQEKPKQICYLNKAQRKFIDTALKDCYDSLENHSFGGEYHYRILRKGNDYLFVTLIYYMLDDKYELYLYDSMDELKNKLYSYLITFYDTNRAYFKGYQGSNRNIFVLYKNDETIIPGEFENIYNAINRITHMFNSIDGDYLFAGHDKCLVYDFADDKYWIE